MNRGATGKYQASSSSREEFRAFNPAKLVAYP